MSLISASVIADSISPNDLRLITLQIKAPKFLDAEFEKHRMLSSNSSSDRAKPLAKMLSIEPYIPEKVYINQAGMQGKEEIKDLTYFHKAVKNLYQCTTYFCNSWKDVHKQHINRYLLPYAYQDKVVTGTIDWFKAFFKLRIHPAAQPEINNLATKMKEAIENSEPRSLKNGDWHLPYVTEKECKELPLIELIQCSVARCARTSYSNHDGSTPDPIKDQTLYKDLLMPPTNGDIPPEDEPRHLSCFEHQATPMKRSFGFNLADMTEKGITHMSADGNLWSANFRGWIQYRKLLD